MAHIETQHFVKLKVKTFMPVDIFENFMDSVELVKALLIPK